MICYRCGVNVPVGWKTPEGAYLCNRCGQEFIQANPKLAAAFGVKTMLKAADLSVRITQPIIDHFKAGGINVLGRYVATGSKSVVNAEIQLCKLNNMGMFFYYEGFGDAATFAGGTQRGVADGRSAAQAAYAVGIPVTVPIAFAVDFGADTGQAAMILAYGAGFFSSSKHAEAIYTDGTVASLEPPGVKIILAGAMGWPGSAAFLASGKAAAVQHPPANLPDGTEYDPVDIYDESLVWWPAGVKQTPAPSTSTGMPAWSITGLQLALSVSGFSPGAIDGQRGPQTQAALLAWYNSL